MSTVGTVTELTDTSTGMWRVSTETSVYLLDFDAREVTRLPGAADMEEDSDAILLPLRKDGRSFPLVELAFCRVGESMVILANGISADPAMFTYRRTTLVREITPITGDRWM